MPNYKNIKYKIILIYVKYNIKNLKKKLIY